MAGRKSDFTLPTNTLDELFSFQEERDEAKLSKIRDIPLEEIDNFPDHPFKVREDKDMFQLVESIKERGVITSATVRQKEDGRYELISGHRRKRACELAGFETLRCEVVDLDRDEATILMVESNFQRSQILPSEKAHAYKMRLDAMKRQAGRPRKENLVPVGQNYSREELASQSGESQTQIQRYVRLTNLVPELLEFVDEGRIKMRPAVELSYLNEDCQRDLVDEIDLNDCTPSHDQAIRMRKFFEEGKLTTEAISAIMSEEKPNQREKIVLRGDRVRSLIPKNIPINQTEEYVCKALELNLASRSIGGNQRTQMCGFPSNRLETYVNMLLDRGFDVSACSLENGERSTRNIVSTNKEDPVQSQPVGRIDYLHTDGTVRESVEYTSPYQFASDIREETYYGVPFKVVFYKDKEGNTISREFAEHLDPPAQSIEIIDSPYLAKDRADEMLRQAEQIAGENTLPLDERFFVIETDDGYAIWDDLTEAIYIDDEGVSEEFKREWQANDYLEKVKKSVSEKEAAEWLYVKRDIGDSIALCQCVAQELGHAELSMNSEVYSRRDMGFQAVCIGYMLCKKYGVDTQNFAIDRIPDELKNKEPKDIKAELGKTQKAFKEITARVSDELYRQRAERSKEQER